MNLDKNNTVNLSLSFLPLESVTCDVTLIVNGNSFGMSGFNPLSANTLCPISLLPVSRNGPVSLVANGGNYRDGGRVLLHYLSILALPHNGA